MSKNNNSTNKFTLVDKIHNNIRRDITEHVLIPGQKINIKELSEAYGASVTPVKLALNRLISENIIENYPRQGMKVKSVQAEELDGIFDMRLMLDLYYTKEIILSVSYNNELREELKSNLEKHKKIVSELNSDSSVDAYLEIYYIDYKFHELYLKCSGNEKIIDMFHYINPFLYSNYLFRKQSREKDIAGVREHEAILNAILNEDEEALRDALRLHINNAKRVVELILKVDKML